jgi:hypothetical protein
MKEFVELRAYQSTVITRRVNKLEANAEEKFAASVLSGTVAWEKAQRAPKSFGG